MRTFDVSKITKNPFYTPLILIESQNPENSMKKYINTAYGTKKLKKYCVTMAYLSLKYCEKSVKTCAGNRGHLTMSHRFFFYESCYWRYKDEHDVFIFCIFAEYRLWNHPPTLEIITPQPWGLPPNPEDHYPPTFRITLQHWGLPPNP